MKKIEAHLTSYDRPSWKYEYEAIEFKLPDGWQLSTSSVSVGHGRGIEKVDVEDDGSGFIRVGIRKPKALPAKKVNKVGVV